MGLKRAIRRIDRRGAAGLAWLVPWGASVTLHAFLLLVLAILIYVGAIDGPGDGGRGNPDDGDFAAQLADDLTSLADGDRSGDPFTRLESDDTPSLSLVEAPTPIDAIALPSLPDGVRLGTEMRLDPIDTGGDAGQGPGAGGASGPSVVGRGGFRGKPGAGGLTLGSSLRMVPFAGRQDPDARARLVRRGGGSVESERAVELGLAWLARHQHDDGHWGLNPLLRCRDGGCPASPAMESDVAATGLALLSYLGAGHAPDKKGRYQGQVRRALDWLLSIQKPDGELYTGGAGNARMYSHAIAVMALGEAFGLTGDEALRDPAQRGVDFIVAAQNARDGGWRYEPGDPGDTSVFGWQMLSLRSAQLAALEVPDGTVQGCRRWLDHSAVDESGLRYKYLADSGPSPVMTAEALLCRQYLGTRRDDPSMVQGAAIVARHLQESEQRNIYYWYYATQMLHNLQNADWRRWNVRVRDGLVSMQSRAPGCDLGSWDPQRPEPDRWGRAAGRHYLTCLSILTLEVYYRYLPVYRERDAGPVGTAAPARRAASGAR